jgi:hypothetical protein
MPNNDTTPTRIVYIVDYGDKSETISLDAKTLSDEELLKEAAAGQKAALYELKARMAQNSPNTDTDKI